MTIDFNNCLVGTLSSCRFKDGQRNFDIEVNGSWRSNNGRALVHAAASGLGLVQLPDFYVWEALETGKLLPILEHFNPTDTAVWAVYPHNRHLSAKVRMFVNYLAEVLPHSTRDIPVSERVIVKSGVQGPESSGGLV